MHITYKPLFWRATRPVNTVYCMNEWKYFIKSNIDILIIIRFKQYLPAIIQSVQFTGRVARQNKGLYVLRMIVKLAYTYGLTQLLFLGLTFCTYINILLNKTHKWNIRNCKILNKSNTINEMLKLLTN